MRSSIVFLVLMILSGCCRLPLINCGPTISELNVGSPTIYVDSNIAPKAEFRAWQYYSRGNKEPLLMNLYCEVSPVDSLLIDRAIVYTAGHANEESGKAVLFEKRTVGDSEIQVFNVEFLECCMNFPVKVQLDSIPWISHKDTIYIKVEVEITE